MFEREPAGAVGAVSAISALQSFPRHSILATTTERSVRHAQCCFLRLVLDSDGHGRSTIKQT